MSSSVGRVVQRYWGRDSGGFASPFWPTFTTMHSLFLTHRGKWRTGVFLLFTRERRERLICKFICRRAESRLYIVVVTLLIRVLRRHQQTCVVCRHHCVWRRRICHFTQTGKLFDAFMPAAADGFSLGLYRMYSCS
ncbi:hypothetical protein NP493_500g02068 [Ridgeia piscesae]|uniref:Uncharacterized protein n=1 Tax=Ridgeia piscesae TaxID=27915 RepID=A0AAD9KYL2_RIDPI|nr:hypothetical protein NP493_500g02068 [Ridgeia piscesae]